MPPLGCKIAELSAQIKFLEFQRSVAYESNCTRHAKLRKEDWYRASLRLGHFKARSTLHRKLRVRTLDLVYAYKLGSCFDVASSDLLEQVGPRLLVTARTWEEIGTRLDDVRQVMMSCNIIPGGDFICHKIRNFARARRARREVPIL